MVRGIRVRGMGSAIARSFARTGTTTARGRLYYHASRGRLLLASEIPALLERLSHHTLDEIAVAEYLATGVLSEGDTFHREIKRVPAASRLSAGPGGSGSSGTGILGQDPGPVA